MLRSHLRGRTVSHTINICSASTLHFFLAGMSSLISYKHILKCSALRHQYPNYQRPGFCRKVCINYMQFYKYWRSLNIYNSPWDAGYYRYQFWQVADIDKLTHHQCSSVPDHSKFCRTNCMQFYRHWKSLNIHNYPWGAGHYWSWQDQTGGWCQSNWQMANIKDWKMNKYMLYANPHNSFSSDYPRKFSQPLLIHVWMSQKYVLRPKKVCIQ